MHDEDRHLADTVESDATGRRKSGPSVLAAELRRIRGSTPYKAQVSAYRKKCSQRRNQDGSRGARCALCGAGINYSLASPHPDSFSVDHIIPVKENPKLIMDVGNWQAAHRGCNSAKGDDDDPLAPGCLGVPSESW